MKKWLSPGLVPLIFCAGALHADKRPTPMKGPWFTGPLITGSAYMIPKDNFNVEPYIYVTRNRGSYDENWNKVSSLKFWSTLFQLPMQVGLNPWMEVTLTPQVFHNRIDADPSLGISAATSTQFADFYAQLGIQIIRAKEEDWYPSIGFQITETFPTGRYDDLDPLKSKMDVGGAGAYATSFTLLFSKLFHINGKHGYLSTRGSVSYTVAPELSVREFNSYGGGFGTRGHVHPGHILQGLIGLEYALTLNWVVAMDLDYIHINKSTFKGNPGILSPGVPATVGYHSSEQFSLAPGLEYNFSERIGVIAGVWFSVLGRNQLDFTAGVAAFNWYY